MSPDVPQDRADLRLVLLGALDTAPKFDLFVFFYRNPDTLDDADGLAGWLGYGRQEMQAAADALVQVGVLVKRGDGADGIYTYTSDAGMLAAIHEFVRAGLEDARRRLGGAPPVSVGHEGTEYPGR